MAFEDNDDNVLRVGSIGLWVGIITKMFDDEYVGTFAHARPRTREET